MMGALRKGLLLMAVVALIGLAVPCLASTPLDGAVAYAQQAYSPATYSPTAISFGEVKVGKSSEVRDVRLYKRRWCIPLGDPPTSYDCSFWTSDVAVSGPFRIVRTDCGSQGGGPPAPSECTVSLKFKPTRRGRQAGFLRLDSNPIVGVALDGKGCRKYGDKLRCKPKN